MQKSELKMGSLLCWRANTINKRPWSPFCTPGTLFCSLGNTKCCHHVYTHLVLSTVPGTPGCPPALPMPHTASADTGTSFPVLSPSVRMQLGAGQTLIQKQQFISPVAMESFQAGQDAPAVRQAGNRGCTRLLLQQESKGSVGSTALRPQGLLLKRCFSSAVCPLQCHLSHQQPSSKGT